MKKYLLIITMTLVFLSACTSFSPYQNKDFQFFKLLGNGFVSAVRSDNNRKVLYRRKHNMIVSCVYGAKPNKVTRLLINQYYSLLHKEIKGYQLPVFKKKVDGCPQASEIFIRLHEGRLAYTTQLKELKWIKDKKNIHLKKPKEFSRLAETIVRVEADKKGVSKILTYISLNQLSGVPEIEHFKLSNNSNALSLVSAIRHSMIIEELYHGTSLGQDIYLYNWQKPMSKLHEVNGFSPRGTLIVDIHNKHNSTGLCGYDLWFLLLNSNRYMHNDIVDFNTFIEQFKKNKVEIKKRAEEIENNPAYKDLFDPRCSGKNTGIYSKIGLEQKQ